MSDCVLRIEKLENGYTVEIKDEAVDKANEKAGPKTPWKDPWKEYAFSTSGEVLNFVKKHLASLPKSPQDEFNDEAAEAFSKED